MNPAESEYSSKNLDHLGIVAVVCREIGLAEEGEVHRGYKRVGP